jgi:hypothetical protein
MTEQHLLISNNFSIKIDLTSTDHEVYINSIKKEFDPIPPSTTPITNEEKLLYAQEEKRKFYRNFLTNHFENLIILSGAGTSMDCDGKTMLILWETVSSEITPDVLENLCKAIGFVNETKDFSTLTNEEKDLEKLLSRANIAKEFIKEYNGNPINIGETVKKCEEIIHINCKLTLKDDAPHEQFLNKITNRKLKDPRVKLFTLNYDTLFEQAGVKGNFTIIDGFSFSSPRTLSGRNFDYDIVYREKSRITEEESFVPKVFHLYKPHGSTNWEFDRSNNTIIINESTNEPLMIFPKDSKYENSYDQPFFEMMSRFQQNLRKDNVLLICLGFSFGDKHIVTAIKEAVTQNPSFRMLIVNRSIRDAQNFKWFLERANLQSNIIIVAEDFKEFTNQYPTSVIYSENTANENSPTV